MADVSALASTELWNPSTELPPRVARLREEYVNIEDREYFRNEIMPFTTGTPWDTVWSPALLGVVPDLIPFYKAFMETLPLAATKVELPDGFWDRPQVVRVATFFHEVVSKYLPVQILDGELIVGAQFNTALSRARSEERRVGKECRSRWSPYH